MTATFDHNLAAQVDDEFRADMLFLAADRNEELIEMMERDEEFDRQKWADECADDPVFVGEEEGEYTP